MQINSQSLFDEAILDELQLISFLLVLLLVVLVVLVGYLCVFATRYWQNVETPDAFNRRQQFLATAEDLADKGDYEELANYCEAYLVEFPSNAPATFYLSFAQFQLGQLDRALRGMSHLREIDPVHSAEQADAYIEVIRAKMKGPKKHDA